MKLVKQLKEALFPDTTKEKVRIRRWGGKRKTSGNWYILLGDIADELHEQGIKVGEVETLKINSEGWEALGYTF